MYIKVIYIDGTSGTVKPTEIDGLIRLGKIIAFRTSKKWVDVRRRSKKDVYVGDDRRRTKPESFFAKFQI